MKTPLIFPLRAAAVALAVVGCGVALAGCTTTQPTADTTSEATEITPAVTEQGQALLASFDDCAGVAEALGTALDGYVVEIDSIDEVGGFCDWRSEASPGQTIGLQIAAQPDAALPDTAAIEASGGVVVADDALTAAGGVLYQIPAEQQGVFSVVGVLPGTSVSITAGGFEVTPEVAQQLTSSVSAIIAKAPPAE